MPDERMLTEMGKYNEELAKAGILLAGEGLHPSSKGKRVRFSAAQRTVIDGPVTETKELIAGFWLWRVRSMDEAVDWLMRCDGYACRVPAQLKHRCSSTRRGAIMAR